MAPPRQPPRPAPPHPALPPEPTSPAIEAARAAAAVAPTVLVDDALGLTRGGLVERQSPAAVAALAAGATIVGGVILPAPGGGKKPPPRGPESDKPKDVSDDNWFFVRSLAEYPGNFPPVDMLRQLGMTGVMIKADDPLRVQGADIARANGFKVGVWEGMSQYTDAATYVGALKKAKDDMGAEAVGLDVETEAKGSTDSDRYALSAAIAALARDTFDVPWAVVPIRSDRNDFDFKAYTDAGGSVVIQTYGADPQHDLFDPVEVINLALAAGVPPDKISVLLSPVQLATVLPELQALGITHISVWTSDGLTPGVIDAASPFLPAPAQTPGAPPADSATGAALPGAPPSPATADPLADIVARFADAYNENTPLPLEGESGEASPDDPPDALGDTATSLAGSLLGTGSRTLAGVRRLAPAPLRGPTPPRAVVDEIREDYTQLKVPRNVAIALRAALLVIQKGIPYVWGGTDPNKGLDCSGYARYVLHVAGVKTIARVTYDQAKQGRAVDAAHRQPLDLLFFEPSSRGPGHVAIYMARGWAVHEPHTGEVAQWLNLATWAPLFTRRYLANITGYQAAASEARQAGETQAAYQHVAPDNAWHILRHRLSTTWPQMGHAARDHADALVKAVDSGK